MAKIPRLNLNNRDIDGFISTDEIVDVQPMCGPSQMLAYIHEIRCECGAEICRTTHSSWCPKYKE